MVPSLHDSFTSENVFPHRGPEDDTALYGIPFDSLVRLTSPNDPFTPLMLTSRGRDPEVATLYSAASVMSVTGATAVRSSLFRPTIRSSRTEDSAHPIRTARADFEERELAADATPLYGAPDDVIEGDNGLVRSIVLNDRIHALTVDTSGEVAVWDVVRGICRGTFTREDVATASLRSAFEGSSGEKERGPREALETVRERMEGEAVVVPWMGADTKTGVLTVHLNEKCFEAEIYADEVGFARDRHYNEETRCANISVLFVFWFGCVLTGRDSEYREVGVAESVLWVSPRRTTCAPKTR
jgi:WD repeat-containing protein 48